MPTSKKTKTKLSISIWQQHWIIFENEKFFSLSWLNFRFWKTSLFVKTLLPDEICLSTLPIHFFPKLTIPFLLPTFTTPCPFTTTPKHFYVTVDWWLEKDVGIGELLLVPQIHICLQTIDCYLSLWVYTSSHYKYFILLHFCK